MKPSRPTPRIKAYKQALVSSALWWLVLPVLVTLLGHLPETLISQSTLLLLYLCTVLLTSLQAGQVAVLACALVSYLQFTFIHTQATINFLIQAPGLG